MLVIFLRNPQMHLILQNVDFVNYSKENLEEQKKLFIF